MIGKWVRRSAADILGKPTRPKTKWHRVESEIAGDVITACGRRMDRTNAQGTLEVRDEMPLTRMIGQPQLCKGGCDRG